MMKLIDRYCADCGIPLQQRHRLCPLHAAERTRVSKLAYTHRYRETMSTTSQGRVISAKVPAVRQQKKVAFTAHDLQSLDPMHWGRLFDDIRSGKMLVTG